MWSLCHSSGLGLILEGLTPPPHTHWSGEREQDGLPESPNIGHHEVLTPFLSMAATLDAQSMFFTPAKDPDSVSEVLVKEVMRGSPSYNSASLPKPISSMVAPKVLK